MRKYDFILAGGGLAGLSLACYLQASDLRDRSILIIDRDAKNKDDRTWSFWIDHPLLFDPVVYRCWDQITFIGSKDQKDFDLAPYHYKTIRGIDFYNHARSILAQRPNVAFLQSGVDQIQDGPDYVRVTAGGEEFEAAWVFNSVFDPARFRFDPQRHHFLKQHFKGWEVETEQDCFNDRSPVLFDFRTPQNGVMRFIYILPYTKRRALVEYTLFSADLLSDEEYDRGLIEYVVGVLGLQHYQVKAVETGVIPMTDTPFQRRAGRRVFMIGTSGGRVKPSSGFAFTRIQNDSQAIVHSLKEYNDPFHIPPDSGLFRHLDSVMLQLMFRNGDQMADIFTSLFMNNPIQRVFRFLDETGSPLQVAQVLASVPPLPFLQAWYKLMILRKV